MSFPKSAPTKVFKNVVVAFAEVWYINHYLHIFVTKTKNAIIVKIYT